MSSKKSPMTEEMREWFRKQGAKGGKRRAANLSEAELSEQGKRAVAVREAKRKKTAK